jgi:hypothetical protein
MNNKLIYKIKISKILIKKIKRKIKIKRSNKLINYKFKKPIKLRISLTNNKNNLILKWLIKYKKITIKINKLIKKKNNKM